MCQALVHADRFAITMVYVRSDINPRVHARGTHGSAPHWSWSAFDRVDQHDGDCSNSLAAADPAHALMCLRFDRHVLRSNTERRGQARAHCIDVRTQAWLLQHDTHVYVDDLVVLLLEQVIRVLQQVNGISVLPLRIRGREMLA